MPELLFAEAAWSSLVVEGVEQPFRKLFPPQPMYPRGGTALLPCMKHRFREPSSSAPAPLLFNRVLALHRTPKSGGSRAHSKDAAHPGGGRSWVGWSMHPASDVGGPSAFSLLCAVSIWRRSRFGTAVSITALGRPVSTNHSHPISGAPDLAWLDVASPCWMSNGSRPSHPPPKRCRATGTPRRWREVG